MKTFTFYVFGVVALTALTAALYMVFVSPSVAPWVSLLQWTVILSFGYHRFARK